MARRKVTTAPVLASWAETDKALRDIRECRHTLAELAVERDRKIDAAKDTYTTTALPVQNRVKELEGQVKAFVDGHRAELVGKSRALNFGVVGYRLSSKLVLPKGRVEHLKYRTLSKPERIKAMIDQKVGKFSKKELMELCPDISKVTMERTLTELVKTGYIEKVGAGPSTGYVRK